MRYLFYLILPVFCLLSCEKDVTNSEVEPIQATEYFPLSVGNYWVYENYKVDSMGTETIFEQKLDSVIITKDTLINNKVYYKLHAVNYYLGGSLDSKSCYYRDSSGYIIDFKGNIRFSNTNLSDTLQRITEYEIGDHLFYSVTYKMEKSHDVVDPYLNQFNDLLNFRGTLTTPSYHKVRYLDNLHAKGVGPIYLSSEFISSPISFKKKLIRYHINQE